MKRTTLTSLFLTLLLALLLAAAACSRQAAPDQATPAIRVVDPAATATPPATPSPAAAATATAAALAAAATAPGSSPTPATALPSLPGTWPPPLTAEPALSRRQPGDGEWATWRALADTRRFRRDDVALAVAFSGLLATPTPRPPLSEPLAVGQVAPFNILNNDLNQVSQISAVLRAVGQHAYFWFDQGPGSVEPSPEQLENVTAAFDDIYEEVVGFFGPERRPGIDGDERVHVVNVSPLALCDVSLRNAGNCWVAGYFSASDALPRAVNPDSNERDMFVMDTNFFGSGFYLSVLGHEFRHMIEDSHDRGDADWEVEGSAMLVEQLLGQEGQGSERANLFLARPDQQLNRWSDEDRLPYYGQAYLFNRYLFDRLGPERYREFAGSPEEAFAALDQLAATAGDASLGGEQLWLDWLAAQGLIGAAGVPARYALSDGDLEPVAKRSLPAGTQTVTDTVAQYAADYYAFSGQGQVTVAFEGSSLVPVLGALPPSGQFMWLARRANYSDARLTRAVDLRAVDRASLTYAVWYDIEEGYDFAYLSASSDGGRTWQGLVAEHMQGLDPADDPSHSALLPRFYTGQGPGWQEEVVDLTPFAGREVLLRFQYVTDQILTNAGIALDNIAIPEIGFYDDGEEADNGWLAEGFVRATAYLPQAWHLQWLTFPPSQPPQVTPVATTDGQATMELDLAQSGGRAILVVAATAPQTLQPAHYRLKVATKTGE